MYMFVGLPSIFLMGKCATQDPIKLPILNSWGTVENEVAPSSLLSSISSCRSPQNNSGPVEDKWDPPFDIHTLLHCFLSIDRISALETQGVLEALNFEQYLSIIFAARVLSVLVITKQQLDLMIYLEAVQVSFVSCDRGCEGQLNVFFVNDLANRLYLRMSTESFLLPSEQSIVDFLIEK